MTVVFPSAGTHPEIVPSSVEKIKRATPAGEPTMKSLVLPLKMSPVGVLLVPAGEPGGGGTVTISPCLVPSAL